MQEYIGRVGELSCTVSEQNTAAAAGSGLMPVFATPQLVALMEGAACEALKGILPEGNTSVGTRIDVQHTSATPIGMRVWAKATLTAVDGRRYSFAIEAFDDAGSVGMATHERVAIDPERFMKKVENKLNLS